MKDEQFELLVNLFNTRINGLRDELKGDIKKLSDSNDSQHKSIRQEIKRINETMEYNTVENRKQHAFMVDMLGKKYSKTRYEEAFN